MGVYLAVGIGYLIGRLKFRGVGLGAVTGSLLGGIFLGNFFHALHLEARYNYEDHKTGSLWGGYNFSVGERVTLEVTPMFGVVFGQTTGVAPGYNLSISYKKIELISQGEYVFDTDDHTGSFFYAWNELVYSPADWFHAGLVAQRTRVYQTPLDVQRGFSVGFSFKRADFTTYVFNAGWTDPTVVLGLTFNF